MNHVVPLESLYLTDKQVAERFAVSTDSIWCWKRQGNFPAPVRVGPNCTRWRLADVLEHESQLRACFAISLTARWAA